MPQSLGCVYVHLVFSTKNREAWIEPGLRPSLHGLFATVVSELDSNFVRAGGTEDHTHILVRLGRTVTVAKVVEKLKTQSSKWMKRQGVPDFCWQRGYGAFSVGHSQVGSTMRYIDRQVQHHRTTSFQDEFRRFLERHEVAFDEQYVWD